MTKEEIIEIKRQGEKVKLLETVGMKLWNARKSLEEASKDEYRFFDNMTKRAIQNIQDAEQLYAEYKQEKI